MLQTVNALLFSPGGRLLLVRRADGVSVEPSKWSLPGGRVELSETLLEALYREIREEIGIDIASCKSRIFEIVNDSQTLQSFYFVVYLDRDEYVLTLESRELQDALWIGEYDGTNLAFEQGKLVERFFSERRVSE